MVTTISRKTMRQIERSVMNLDAGKVAGPINIKAGRKLSRFPASKKKAPAKK
ncbi:MAG: hypothetical protein WCH43_06985 [Verrucomicrobiota bacterium]